MGTPSNGPRQRARHRQHHEEQREVAGPTSNSNDAKPQMAMTAIQFPISLMACPARSTANPRTRSTRIPAR